MFAIVGAWAGQVHHRESDLESVLAATSAAVIVRFGAEISSPVAIPIPSATGKDCGTYGYGVTEATVERVLLAPSAGPSLTAGDLLAVYPADTASLIALSTLACDTGASESPIFDRFPGVTPVPGGTAIALLQWAPPYGWIEATSGSWLPVGRAGEVTRADGVPSRPVDPKAAIACRVDADCTRSSLACGPCGSCPEPAPPPVHRLTARHHAEVCAASRPSTRPGAPPFPEPNCALCPAPSGRPFPDPPVCRAMRCVEPSP